MATEAAVKRAYELLQNHRAVAAKLELPMAYVLHVLGFMSEELYIRVC